MVKKDALLVYLQRRLFLLFYRATALQRGNSFPSCAWRISQLHRAFSLTFALDFLDLTTFLRQILGKIYLSDFLTTPHLFYYQISGILAIFFYSAFPSGKIILNTKKKITMETPPVIIVTSML